MLLYDGLKNNFDKLKKDHPKKEDCFEIEMERQPLRFCKTYFKHYAEASLYVMLHNIWFCNGEENILRSCYENHGLKKLIDPKLKYDGTDESIQLFFLMQLADTIEPTKRWKCADCSHKCDICKGIDEKNFAKDILGNIRICNDDRQIELHYDAEKLKKNNFDLDKWRKGVKDFGKWTTMEVEEVSDNTLTIRKPL